jgi:hypothetical protein
MKNQLFYGDNLNVLRQYIHDESVDLVYLDPPFNSQQNYNVLFRDRSGKRASAQQHAFEDTVTRGPAVLVRLPRPVPPWLVLRVPRLLFGLRCTSTHRAPRIRRESRPSTVVPKAAASRFTAACSRRSRDSGVSSGSSSASAA